LFALFLNRSIFGDLDFPENPKTDLSRMSSELQMTLLFWVISPTRDVQVPKRDDSRPNWNDFRIIS